MGYGKCISDALRRAGYNVTTTGRTSGNFIADVGNVVQWKKTVEKISQNGKDFSVVIFVAGYARYQKDHDEVSWVEHTQKNVAYIKQTINTIPLSKNARIVTIGSQWSYKRGMKELEPYIESKHELREFTEKFAQAHQQFSVVHMCPPTMKTEQLKKVIEGGFCTQGITVDPGVVGEAMVRKILGKVFRGETVQFDENGGLIVITKEKME